MTKEVVIRSEWGSVVARLNLDEGILNGHCEWYDGRGNLVAYGVFKQGVPHTGTFPNWARFFSNPNEENVYESQTYCQDWVTTFESMFDSEPPTYEMVLEAYSNGKNLNCR
jgi:hypothetical protein